MMGMELAIECATPRKMGEQRIELLDGAIYARSGSGFDCDSPIHKLSDGPRYAIAIQQLRDAKEYGKADNLAEFVSKFYRVIKTKDATGVISKDGSFVFGYNGDGILEERVTQPETWRWGKPSRNGVRVGMRPKQGFDKKEFEREMKKLRCSLGIPVTGG